jgi:hypothetical protein
VERFKPGVNPGWRRKRMDKFLHLQRILTETDSLAKDKTSLETRLAAHPVRNPKDSILTSLPFYSMKKHDRIITDKINTRGAYQKRTLKLMPKKPGNRLESVGEFTLKGAVDVLLATTTGETSRHVQKRGAHQRKKITIKPKKDTIKCLGELTLLGVVDVLMAIRNNRRKNEARKKGLRWKRNSRFFQKRTADLWV